MPTARQSQVLSAQEAFLSTPLDAVLQQAADADAGAHVLDLFHRVAARVPAYQAFLGAHGIDPDAIQTLDDFRTLPLITKKNYVQRYPLADLCWDRRLENCDMIAVSSGSTGQPTFWPHFITVGLEQPEINAWVTGKFVLEALEDADANRVLSIAVELAPGAEASDARQQAVAEAIHTQLVRLNSEFANYVPREYQLPRVTLLPTGDPAYFPVGVKHRYTRKPTATP